MAELDLDPGEELYGPPRAEEAVCFSLSGEGDGVAILMPALFRDLCYTESLAGDRG